MKNYKNHQPTYNRISVIGDLAIYRSHDDDKLLIAEDDGSLIWTGNNEDTGAEGLLRIIHNTIQSVGLQSEMHRSYIVVHESGVTIPRVWRSVSRIVRQHYGIQTPAFSRTDGESWPWD